MEQIAGKFHWPNAARRQRIPAAELQRLDDLASRGHDEVGGYAADNVANPSIHGELVPAGLQAIWAQITASHPASGAAPPRYSAVEVRQWYATETEDQPTYEHSEASFELTEQLVEADLAADVRVGSVVRAWPTEDLDEQERIVWRFCRTDSDGVRFVRVDSSPDPDGVYQGTVMEYDTPGKTWQVREAVRGVAANGETLTNGRRYIGRRAPVDHPGPPALPLYELEDDESGGFNLTVREVDLVPSISNVNTIEFYQPSGGPGLVVTDEGGGVARVSLFDPPGGYPFVLTVREVDGVPTVVPVTVIEFYQPTVGAGLVVTDEGGGVARVALAGLPGPTPPFNLTVREVDGVPTFANIHTVEFYQTNGFSVEQPGAGIARVNMTHPVFNLRVREVDAVPTINNVSVIEFNQNVGFVVTAAGESVARVDLDPVRAQDTNQVDYHIVADDAWEFIGLSVTLPAAGTYRLTLSLTGMMSVAASVGPSSCAIAYRLWDQTAGAVILNTKGILVWRDNVTRIFDSVYFVDSASLDIMCVFGGATEVRVQCLRTAGGTAQSWLASIVLGGANAPCVLNAEKLSDSVAAPSPTPPPP